MQGPSERRNTILLALLFKSPKKVLINDLFDEYYVSNTVITNDLVRMNEFLLKYQLSLIRKGQRVSIEGEVLTKSHEERTGTLSAVAPVSAAELGASPVTTSGPEWPALTCIDCGVPVTFFSVMVHVAPAGTLTLSEL